MNVPERWYEWPKSLWCWAARAARAGPPTAKLEPLQKVTALRQQGSQVSALVDATSPGIFHESLRRSVHLQLHLRAFLLLLFLTDILQHHHHPYTNTSTSKYLQVLHS